MIPTPAARARNRSARTPSINVRTCRIPSRVIAVGGRQYDVGRRDVSRSDFDPRLVQRRQRRAIRVDDGGLAARSQNVNAFDATGPFPGAIHIP